MIFLKVLNISFSLFYCLIIAILGPVLNLFGLIITKSYIKRLDFAKMKVKVLGHVNCRATAH